MGYNFFVKSNIDFGRGALEDLAGIIQGYGMKSVMIVYDGGVKAAGIADKVVAQVEKAGIPYVIFDGVIPNPTNEVVEDAAAQAKEAKVNPYKEAKKTGKSVEEIVEKDQKRKEKLAKKAEEDDDDDDDDDDEDYLEEGHYRVKTKRTVASGGSSYITGRKAEAEARAEREARYARNQAKQKKKVKGKGKKK